MSSRCQMHLHGLMLATEKSCVHCAGSLKPTSAVNNLCIKCKYCLYSLNIQMRSYSSIEKATLLKLSDGWNPCLRGESCSCGYGDTESISVTLLHALVINCSARSKLQTYHRCEHGVSGETHQYETVPPKYAAFEPLKWRHNIFELCASYSENVEGVKFVYGHKVPAYEGMSHTPTSEMHQAGWRFRKLSLWKYFPNIS